jgi:hypothetical protein
VVSLCRVSRTSRQRAGLRRETSESIGTSAVEDFINEFGYKSCADRWEGEVARTRSLSR